jgi:hypothetical protein
MGGTKIYRTFSGDQGLEKHESLGMSNSHYPNPTVLVALPVGTRAEQNRFASA